MPLKCRNQRDIKLLVKYDFSSWRKKLEQDTKPAKTWQTFGRECHQTFKLHVCVFYLENVQAQAIAFSVRPQHYKRLGYFSHNEGLDGGNFSQVCSLEHQIFQYALGRRYNIQVNIGKHSHSITVLKFTLHIHVLNGLRVNSLNGLAGAKLLVQLCSFRHYLSILNFRNFTVSGIY